MSPPWFRRVWIVPVASLITLWMPVSCRPKVAAPAPAPVPVTVQSPVRQEVTIYAEFPASLEADSLVEIRARVSGILEATHFTDGSTVEQGQLLFEIEPDAYQQAVVAAEADVKRADAARELAAKRLGRLSQAVQKNAVSELDVEIASAELGQAIGRLEQAQATLANARLQLGYTRIHSPISGRISESLAGLGNLVGYGEPTVLARIVDDSKVSAYFEVPERDVIRYLEARADQDAARLVRAKPIGLRLADGSLYDHVGQIDFIDNAVDPRTRTNRVRAVFENPDGKLAAGLYGLVRVPVSPNPQDPSQKQALTIPATAIQRDLAGTFVWTVDGADTVRRSPVTLGREMDAAATGGTKLAVVLAGLEPSQRVIVGGIQRVREGAVVVPQVAASAAAE